MKPSLVQPVPDGPIQGQQRRVSEGFEEAEPLSWASRFLALFQQAKPAPIWIFLLLLAAAFASATLFQPHAAVWTQRQEAGGGGLLKLILGDSRQMFANHYFIKADVYFHSGFYPSIFDQQQAPKGSAHLTSQEGSPEDEAHDRAMNFLGTPHDWIERFGRHFMITEHTHLQGKDQREILPWLRISADLDPHRIDTYTVAAYWLRTSLGKVAEAEQFLREGLRNNPASYDLWFELGMLYHENTHDEIRARNAWEVALRYWNQQEPLKAEPDRIGRDKIVINLARLEEREGNFDRAIEYLKMAEESSPNPEVIRQQISELEQKRAAQGAR